jgi:AcrR family transcriptional regulator
MDKKESILLAAQEIFGANGFSRATMKMIADKANVAFGLVAHYFGDKNKLFMTSGFEMVNSLLTHVRKEAEGAENGLEAVRAFITSYFSFVMKNRRTFPILLHCTPFADDSMTMDRSAIARKFKELIDEVESYIARGIKDGSIRELPLCETAFTIYAVIVGAVRTRLVAQYTVPNLFEETVEFVIRSLSAGSRGADSA